MAENAGKGDPLIEVREAAERAYHAHIDMLAAAERAVEAARREGRCTSTHHICGCGALGSERNKSWEVKVQESYERGLREGEGKGIAEARRAAFEEAATKLDGYAEFLASGEDCASGHDIFALANKLREMGRKP